MLLLPLRWWFNFPILKKFVTIYCFPYCEIWKRSHLPVMIGGSDFNSLKQSKENKTKKKEKCSVRLVSYALLR